MAEETTSVPASEAPPEGQAQPTSPTPPIQPVTATEPPAKPVNLYELPEFRKFQSELTRREQEKERAHQQQLAQANARLKELEIRDLTDEQRLAYEVQERDRQLAAYQQREAERLEREQLERQKFEDLHMLSEATGVPMQDLFEAQDRNHAVQLARQKAEERLQQQQQQRQAASEAMRPDLGSGKSPAAGSERSKALQKALKENDALSFYERILKKE